MNPVARMSHAPLPARCLLASRSFHRSAPHPPSRISRADCGKAAPYWSALWAASGMDRALSDGALSLDFSGFERLLGQLRRLAEPLGKVLNRAPTSRACGAGSRQDELRLAERRDGA